MIEDFVAAWNRLDLDKVEAMLAPDVFYHNIPMEPCIGRAAFRAAIATLPAIAANWTIHVIAASGNCVLTERTDAFTLAGGKQISIRVMGTFEIEHGLIAKWRDYFDPAEFQR